MSTSRLQNKTIKPYLENGIEIRLIEKKNYIYEEYEGG
jgi:hypothetical protein